MAVVNELVLVAELNGPGSVDGYRLRSSADSACSVAGLSTGGVAHATQAPTVVNPCSSAKRCAVALGCTNPRCR
jgi:hypothetical protein